MLKPTDLLKVTPGLFTGQHAGGGKANQYFLRGFDIDHGTDLALWVDGMPVNMVSHGHGQGYADLHFIIPELFDRVEVQKGPYAAQLGDFATAGAVRMRTRDRFDSSFALVAGGPFQTYRFLGLYTDPQSRYAPVLAAEIYRDDGPFQQPEDLERYKLFWRNRLMEGGAEGDARVDLTLMSYGSDWNGSGQVPLRAVESGDLDRFGSVDPTEGGNSQRHSAQLRARFGDADRASEWNLDAYLLHYRFALYSNFTFFAGDAERGDQIEQTDRRTVAGFQGNVLRRRTLAGRPLITTLGLNLRNDFIENGLGPTENRKRLGTTVNARVQESSMGLFLQEDYALTDWLRFVGGLRADYFGFQVSDELEDQDPDAPKTSGVRSASIISPKANFIVGPFEKTELYLNFGQGFHSNDARGVVRRPEGVTPLAAALGYEIGLRTHRIPRLEMAASAWRLDMESELVWVGDEGTTEARPATERMGVDFEARARLLSWLFADLDLTQSRAVYTENSGNGDAVALAPTFTLAGGLSWQHASGITGSLRVQHLAERPAVEDESLVAEGFTQVDASLAYRWRDWEVRADAANLLNTEWREAQFANESRLANEAEAVEDIHFVPGTPFQVQGTLKRYF
jgi:outer membrane receptor protein involved in Fe transport